MKADARRARATMKWAIISFAVVEAIGIAIFVWNYRR